jgi:hypothetical protein
MKGNQRTQTKSPGELNCLSCAHRKIVGTIGIDLRPKVPRPSCKSLTRSESKDVLGGLHHEDWPEEIAA